MRAVDVDFDGFERGNASGRATRALLMRTAEELIARRGIDGVSLREIGQRCGQRNTGAAQYHFGNKQGLIEAIFVTRTAGVNRRRSRMLRELDESSTEVDTLSLVRVALQPHIETLTRPDDHFVGFLARLLTDRGTMELVDQNLITPHQEPHQRLLAALQTTLPGPIDLEVLGSRYNRMIGWALHSLAEMDISREELDHEEIDDLIGMLARSLG